MKTVEVRNVHQALPEALYQLQQFGKERESRNGPVLQYPGPFTTVYEKPFERVLFYPERDANPFFHFFESLWMLAGRDDVAYVQRFASKMGDFSDDGKRFNAAYGHRWRRHFGGRDQLKIIYMALKANPDCRRQVLAIWDGHHDLGLGSKDLPCNTQAMFQVSADGALDMMVTNRSNDAIWGAYGANAVQFGTLLEYMAAMVERPVGRYWQVSFNTHLYLDLYDGRKMMEALAPRAVMPPAQRECPYARGEVSAYPLVTGRAYKWDRELERFMAYGGTVDYDEPFFEEVAKPMLLAWDAFKSPGADRFSAARRALERCLAADWKVAGAEWITRREGAWRSKQAS